MTYAHRNMWLYSIVKQTSKNVDLTKSFFEQDWNALYDLDKLAECMRIKGNDGKSPARTLFDRCKAAKMPF